MDSDEHAALRRTVLVVTPNGKDHDPEGGLVAAPPVEAQEGWTIGRGREGFPPGLASADVDADAESPV